MVKLYCFLWDNKFIVFVIFIYDGNYVKYDMEDKFLK